MKNLTFIFCAAMAISCAQQAEPIHLVGWGDSMLKGSGGKKSILEVISAELNLSQTNLGVGGLKSRSVGVLQGGIPLKLVLENTTINAEGDTNVVFYNIEPINFQTKQYRTGHINNTTGKLRRISDEENKKITLGYTFEADNLSENIKVADTVQFIFDDALKYNNGWTIIWAGRNDRKAGDEVFKTKGNIQAMVDHLGDNAMEHYLILSICNGIADKEGAGSGAYKNISRLNTVLKESFQENFIDVRSYMVNQAIYDMGIEPTQQDKDDMAKDCIPRRFLKDHVHFNTLGYEATGKYLVKTIKDRGWITRKK